MTPPKVFISYSHDSGEHKTWVLRLASDLREYGVDATLDQWDLKPGQDVTAYMQCGIVESDRVLLVCSESYVSKAESALMFASSLYQNLGLPADEKVSIRVAHRGLRGRALAAVGNRHVLPRVSHEAVVESEVVVVAGNMRETLVEDVRRLVEPMFMLFDFMEFSREIYQDIVRRYERGETS